MVVSVGRHVGYGKQPEVDEKEKRKTAALLRATYRKQTYLQRPSSPQSGILCFNGDGEIAGPAHKWPTLWLTVSIWRKSDWL